MPLNRPALSLGPGARGVQDARRWVVRTCLDIGRPDLVECAELAVSELVTNALLHGAPPIEVRVRGTSEHPRVEVRDASTEPPRPPPEAADDDLLLTFGRGLSIVGRAAKAWGTDIERDGKVVWFTPAREFAQVPVTPQLVTGDDAASRGGRAADLVEVELRNVPITDYLDFQRHHRELRREVRLLALTHQEDYALAKSLYDVFGALDQPLRDGLAVEQVEAARSAGHHHANLHVVIDREAAHNVGRLTEVLDLADAFCREERLLSVARSDAQRRFQTWFLGELVRQAAGEPPMPWPRTEEAQMRRSRIS